MTFTLNAGRALSKVPFFLPSSMVKTLGTTNNASHAYQDLCSEFYDRDKPGPSPDSLAYYHNHAKVAKGSILEPMSGSGRYLIPLTIAGFDVTGFDSSQPMLDLCTRKCERLKINPTFSRDTFESFQSKQKYSLAFIPAGSICILTTPQQVQAALSKLRTSLDVDGKLILEILTVRNADDQTSNWKGRWVKREDDSKIVLSTLANFNQESRVNTTLCRYESWANNRITKIQVEDFQLRFYGSNEFDAILKNNGFKILQKGSSYSLNEVKFDSEEIIYECERA